MQTAEGLKTFCYPSVGLVTKTGDWAKPSARAWQSLAAFLRGRCSIILTLPQLWEFFLLSSLLPSADLPSAFPQQAITKSCQEAQKDSGEYL
jgi:hypothetical protein